MSKYQITLTPVDKFFFGGDMTFQIGNDEKFNRQYSSYIIHSMMFPQQTTLLGMLRFLILQNAGEDVFAGNKIVDEAKAKELIGDKSFKVEGDNDFRTIKYLSHVRVRSKVNGKSTDLEIAPLYEELSFEDTTQGSYNLRDICIPSLTKECYDAKKGLDLKLTDGQNMFKLEDVFVEDRRVGISRDIKTGIVDDKALFKQISYRFASKEYCFVFEAEIDDKVPFGSYSGQLVTVGGDNSQFVVDISTEIQTNKCLKAGLIDILGDEIFVLY